MYLSVCTADSSIRPRRYALWLQAITPTLGSGGATPIQRAARTLARLEDTDRTGAAGTNGAADKYIGVT
jgi:hypothetical protein